MFDSGNCLLPPVQHTMRSAQCFRKKLVHGILWTTIYSSVALGIWPFKYDAKAQRLQRSKWLIVYGLLVNSVVVALLLLSPVDYSMQSELFERNRLTGQINIVQGFVTVLTVLVTLLRNWSKSEELASILNELRQLQGHNLLKAKDECVEFDSYVIYKAVFILLQVASSALMVLGFTPTYTTEFYKSLLSAILMQLMMLLVALHFFLAVVSIYRCIWTINWQLLKLANELAGGRGIMSIDAVDVQELHHLYNRVLQLSRRFDPIYDYQRTLMMVTFLGLNIVSIYFFIVLHVSLKMINSPFEIFLFAQSIVINSWDFWLSIAVCERAERFSQKTSRILQLFNDFEDFDLPLEQNLEAFALFCSHQRLQFRHLDLFDVNNATGFKMVCTSILYLVYLVQFDFRNL